MPSGRAIKRLTREANDLRERGRFGEAIEMGSRAVELARSELPDGDPLLGWVLNSMAVIYQDAGEFRAAEPFYRETLEINRNHLGEDHAVVALILNSLAGLYGLMGDHARAADRYREALEIRRRVLDPDDPAIAESLGGLAEANSRLGDYASAEPLLREALQMQRRSLPSGHPAMADTLNGLGIVFGQLGDLATAGSFLREALDIQQRAFGPRHPAVAGTLANLGVLHGHLGMFNDSYADLEEAERLLRQALTIQAATLGPGNPFIAGTMANLGAAYRQLSLSGARFQSSYHEQAARLYREALDLRRRTLGEGHPEVAQTLNNLAVLRHDVGDRSEAEALYREALDLRRRTLGEEHPLVGLTTVNLAEVVAAERPAEALSLLEEAAAIQDRIMGQVFVIASERQRLAHVEQLRGALFAHLSLVRRSMPEDWDAVGSALDLVLRRKAIGAEALAAQRDAVLGGRYPELAPTLRELMNLRMRIAQKALAGPGPEGLEEHRATLREWEESKEALEAELAGAIPEMRLEERLREADREAVAAALPDRSVLVKLLRFDPFDFTAVPSRGEAPWKPSRYLAFVLPAGEPGGVRMIDLGEAGPIDDLIARFRDAVTRQGRDRAAGGQEQAPVQPGSGDREVGTALRTAIFDPLVPYLRGRTRLFLAPDGELTRLPFEVLPTDDERRLIDDHLFSYLSTGRDALRFDPSSDVEGAAPVVAAAPDFDLGGRPSAPPPGRRSRDLQPSAIHFDPLNGTESEGKGIGEILGTSPWLGDGVLEVPLKTARAPRILHLATHGFFLPDQGPAPATSGPGLETQEIGPMRGVGMENPLLRSGLALAGANTFLAGRSLPPDAEDGILTAEDVSGLDLMGTELVVLSACETGLGEIRMGEGVFGLRRAFVLAGARTLVMSLWKVPDEPTAEMMTAFYRNLAKGMGRAEALRAAQLAMATVYPPPQYWGAFICQGDPGRLGLHGVDKGSAPAETTAPATTATGGDRDRDESHRNDQTGPRHEGRR